MNRRREEYPDVSLNRPLAVARRLINAVDWVGATGDAAVVSGLVGLNEFFNGEGTGAMSGLAAAAILATLSWGLSQPENFDQPEPAELQPTN